MAFYSVDFKIPRPYSAKRAYFQKLEFIEAKIKQRKKEDDKAKALKERGNDK